MSFWGDLGAKGGEVSAAEKARQSSMADRNVNRAPKRLSDDAYTVAWVTVLNSGLEAARLLFDEEHELIPMGEKYRSNYLLGRMGMHNVVIAFPDGETYGTDNVAKVLKNMAETFRGVRFALLVGVGGGAPMSPNLEDPSKDIRLGDIVVGHDPCGVHGGVLQYDLNKCKANGELSIESTLKSPPDLLLRAVRLLKYDHNSGKGEMSRYIQRATAITRVVGRSHANDCQYPGQDQDRLFKAGHKHAYACGEDCERCDAQLVERRLQRDSNKPQVHYKSIASWHEEMRDAEGRDKLRDIWGVSCFETESAGLNDDFPCIVVRGICDYSDDHKNEVWKPYSSVVAASYAKDLLRVIKAGAVAALTPVVHLPIYTAKSKPTLEDQVAELQEEVKRLTLSKPTLEDQIAGLKEEVKRLNLQLLKVSETPPQLPRGAFFESGVARFELGSIKGLYRRIIFSNKYTSNPMVTVSLCGADVEHDKNLRLITEVESVDLAGFTLKVSTWCDTFVHGCTVQWSAFGH
ncbi:hypothetical protein TWF481_009151 [Arthrobotrys musiformis]|uniref:H-type lectin domain-containing protein n=1 Tax=Arthrobotrys musiformis TaxID=47236 RepID=A0AAV9W4W9_9PEZI